MVCLGIGPLAWVLLADLALPKVLHLLFDFNDKKNRFLWISDAYVDYK